MSEADLIPLYDHYEEIIEKMPRIFTSHQFILRLANTYQKEYIEGLYAYRFEKRENRYVPFMNVHRALATHLKNYPDLVKLNRSDIPSKDIFGNDATCAEWKKVR